MFKLFSGGKNYSVGVDFGTSAIKVVELSFRNQKIFLENYGWVDLGLTNTSSISKPGVSMPQDPYNKKLQKYLKKLISSMKLKSGSAYISLPGFSGLITMIEFPEMNREDLEEAIRFEARKYIPISLDEVALDWEIIGKGKVENSIKPGGNTTSSLGSEKSQESSIWKGDLKSIMNKRADRNFNPDAKNEILLVAAPKSEVIRCGNLVKESGLSVKNVELELFSLVRAMVDGDPGCFLIIDIGARITNIILVAGGIIKVNRNLEGGGNEITRVISESLNISKQRAEEMKKENKDFLNSKEMPLSVPVLDIIANESTRIIGACRSKDVNVRIDSVILSGGSSKMKGIDTYFGNKLGIQTKVGNPWRKINISEKLSPFVEKMGTSFSVALGLALRGLEENNKEE